MKNENIEKTEIIEAENNSDMEDCYVPHSLKLKYGIGEEELEIEETEEKPVKDELFEKFVTEDCEEEVKNENIGDSTKTQSVEEKHSHAERGNEGDDCNEDDDENKSDEDEKSENKGDAECESYEDEEHENEGNVECESYENEDDTKCEKYENTDSEAEKNEFVVVECSDEFSNEKTETKSFLARIDRKKGMIMFFTLSVLFHLFVFEVPYFLGQKQEKPKNKEVAFKIVKPIEKPKPKPPVKKVKKQTEKQTPPEKKEVAKPAKPAIKKQKDIVKKPKTSKPKRPSRAQLVATGKRYIGKVKNGSFPNLHLSYSSPSNYIREMYNLRAKTLIYDAIDGSFYEVSLFSDKIFKKLGPKDFNGYSTFKRVIDDSQWDFRKEKIASQLNARTDDLEILLLVPMSVELRWIGHQVSIFKKMNLKISEIDSVEANFSMSKLKIKHLYLKDGSEKVVNDFRGA